MSAALPEDDDPLSERIIAWQKRRQAKLAEPSRAPPPKRALRTAVLRNAHHVQVLHANRRYTSLTCMISEADQGKMAPLATLSPVGELRGMAALEGAIDAAEQQLRDAQQRQRQQHVPGARPNQRRRTN